MRKYIIYIGIDCGVETGIGMWHRPSKKLIAVKTLKIHQAMAIVLENHMARPDEVFVRVEDARQRKNPKFYGTQGSAKLQGVGAVKRDAKIWEDFLTDHKIPFVMAHPRNTKMEPDYFKKLTGWTERTSEHARDAATLVFGM